MQKKETKLFLLSRTLSTLLHIPVLILFLSSFERFGLPERWLDQWIILFLVSFLSAAVLIFRYSAGWVIASLLIRSCAMLITGYPLGGDLVIETILLAGILWDLSLYSSKKVMIVCALILTAAFFSLQMKGFVWNQMQMPPSAAAKTAVALILLTYLIILFIIDYYRRRAGNNRVLIDSYESTVSNLMEANLKLQDNIIKEIESTLNKERKRIARELHDIIGHSMVNILMLSENVKDNLHSNPPAALQMLDQVHEISQKVINDTEGTLRHLKGMDSERKFDTVAIKRLIDVFSKATGVDVSLELRNIPLSFGSGKNRIVYRIIQEALTNSFRHGKASRIDIMFWKADSEIELIIRDNGSGSKDVDEGIGLWGIRERLTAISGRMAVQSSKQGFLIVVHFPWNGV